MFIVFVCFSSEGGPETIESREIRRAESNEAALRHARRQRKRVEGVHPCLREGECCVISILSMLKVGGWCWCRNNGEKRSKSQEVHFFRLFCVFLSSLNCRDFPEGVLGEDCNPVSFCHRII